MIQTKKYRTKQAEAIYTHLALLQGKHITVYQLKKHLGACDLDIGFTTIYRHLDALVKDGTVKRIHFDGCHEAYYQYAGDEASAYHVHMKCDFCMSDSINQVKSRLSSQRLSRSSACVVMF